jgi:transcriptional regulator
MYVPQHFAETDLAHQHEVIRRNPFGVITSVVDGRLMATHIPFLVEPNEGPHGTLHAHMARANPHWRAFDGKAEALVVFSGPHGYISPSWYKRAPAVPTWNYVAVHVYGTPVVVDDPARSKAHLGMLARVMETGRDKPWRIEDQPAAFIDGMVSGVVAFEIRLTRIEGKSKMSQNRDLADRRAVAAALRAEGHAALAEAMESEDKN